MKSILLLLVSLLGTAMADDIDQIAAARRTFEHQAEAAVAPLRQAYIAKLQQLSTEFTKAGRLEAALGARTALVEADVRPTFPPFSGTSWKWWDGKQFTFAKDGLIHHPDWTGQARWEYVGNGVVIITRPDQSRHVLIRFALDYKSFTGWDFDGSKLPELRPWR